MVKLKANMNMKIRQITIIRLSMVEACPNIFFSIKKAPFYQLVKASLIQYQDPDIPGAAKAISNEFTLRNIAQFCKLF